MLAGEAESGLVESKHNYADKLCSILENENQIHSERINSNIHKLQIALLRVSNYRSSNQISTERFQGRLLFSTKYGWTWSKCKVTSGT